MVLTQIIQSCAGFTDEGQQLVYAAGLAESARSCLAAGRLAINRNISYEKDARPSRHGTETREGRLSSPPSWAAAGRLVTPALSGAVGMLALTGI